MENESIYHATPSSGGEIWELVLFVAGEDGAALKAQAKLRSICDKHLSGPYVIDVVDILKDPELADAADIVATPTLIRRQPKPARRIIGDLSITEKVLSGLGLPPQATN